MRQANCQCMTHRADRTANRIVLGLMLLFILLLLSATTINATATPICHVPPGNPDSATIITPDDPAWPSHANHSADYPMEHANECPPYADELPDTTVQGTSQNLLIGLGSMLMILGALLLFHAWLRKH